MAERKTVTKVVEEAKVSSAVHGLSVAAMVIGIVGVVFGWIPFLGFVIAGTALTFGIIGLAKRAPNHGMALAGTILGGVGLLINFFMFLAFVGVLFGGGYYFPMDGGHYAQPNYYYSY